MLINTKGMLEAEPEERYAALGLMKTDWRIDAERV